MKSKLYEYFFLKKNSIIFYLSKMGSRRVPKVASKFRDSTGILKKVRDYVVRLVDQCSFLAAPIVLA